MSLKGKPEIHNVSPNHPVGAVVLDVAATAATVTVVAFGVVIIVAVYLHSTDVVGASFVVPEKIITVLVAEALIAQGWRRGIDRAHHGHCKECNDDEQYRGKPCL